MQGHSIAINGLTVARQSLEVVGNNLANAATEGYHRQEAMVAPLSGDPLARIPIGYGAEVTQIRRAADLLLETQIWNHRPELGQTEEELATLEALESVLGDMTTGGLATALGDFFQALQTLASAPGNVAFRTRVVEAADRLALEFRTLGSAIDELRGQVVHEAQETVTRLNELAAQIAEMNLTLQDLRSRNAVDGNLLDRRDQAVADLAELASLRVLDDGEGAYSVYAWGTPVVFKGHVTELEVAYAGEAALGVSVAGADYYDTEAQGGRLGALVALANDYIPQIQGRLDALARAVIQAVNRCHVEGLGSTGPMRELTGWAVSAEPLGEWALPVSAGDIHVRITDTTTGEVRRYQVTVADPATETVADLVAKFDAVPHLSATLTQGGVHLSAEGGYTFDFLPAVLPEPTTSTLTGTATATLGGVWRGEANDVLTATVVGGGEVGVTEGLALEVRSAAGDLLRTVNLGAGYEAGEAVTLADGVTVAFTRGTLNAGEGFTVEVLAHSDTTGFLAAAGLGALFAGTGAGTMDVVDRVRTDPTLLAGALGTDGLDNLNLLRMAEVAETPLDDLDGQTPDEVVRETVSTVGHWVAFRSERREGLENLLEELLRRRESACGVDINEEAANVLVLERMFQGMAKYLAAIDRAQETLMDLV